MSEGAEASPFGTDPEISGGTSSRSRRVAWLGCLGLFVLCALFMLFLIFGDGPPPDDFDLLPPPRVEVPADQNLFGALAALHPRYRRPQLHELQFEMADGRPAEPWPDPWSRSEVMRARWAEPAQLEALEACFRELDPVLAEVTAALDLPHCQFPFMESSLEIDDSMDREIMVDAHKQLSLRAVLRRARGDVPGASRDLANGLRIGDAMLDNAESIGHAAFGSSVVLSCWERVECLLHDGELAPEVEAALFERESKWLSDPEWMTRVIRHDYRLQRATTERVADGEVEDLENVPEPLLRSQFPRNRALTRFAEVYRELIELSNAPPLQRDRSSPDPVERKNLLDRSLTIERLAELTLSGFVPVLERADRTRLAERAGRTLVALRIHERTRGSLPSDLEALVAAVPELGSVPIDPWTGAPLRYDAARRLLWAVGEDGIDGGGDGWEELRADPDASRFQLPDWVWQIPPIP